MTNCPILNDSGRLAAVAARLQALSAAGPVCCLTPDDVTAADLKKTVGGVSQLPPIVSLPRLLTVIARLPQASLSVWLLVARLVRLPVDADARLQTWDLFHSLRDEVSYSDNAACFHLAGKLARLFGEVDEHLPFADSANPFAVFKDRDKSSHEGDVAGVMWDNVLNARPKRQLLAQLAEKLDRPLLAVEDEETSPLVADFYRHHATEIGQLKPPAAALAIDEMLQGKSPVADTRTYWQDSAASLNDAAELALHRIRALRADDDTAAIGVVVYDRLLARRLRAVAEADGVWIKDSVGWRAETLSIGAALRTFVAAALGEFNPLTVTELLRAPFFTEYPRRAVAERQWRKHFTDDENLSQSAAELATNERADLADWGARLQAIRRQAPPDGATLRRWLQWLREDSDEMLAAWRGDAAARDLFADLAQQSNDRPFCGDEFRLWLDNYLATDIQAGGDVDSAVKFVSPTTRGTFSAILLLGHVDRMPEYGDEWLGEVDRPLLNLPTREQRLAVLRRRFCRLIAAHQRVAAVWRQCGDDGEEQPPHPHWRLLPAKEASDIPPAGALAAAAPAETVPSVAGAKGVLARWPNSLSLATAGGQIMACPYRCYVNTLLGLRDMEACYDDEPSPLFVGKLLHRLLAEFAEGSREETDEAILAAQWRAIVARGVPDNRPSLKLWAAYWLNTAESFIQWEVQRRAQGWRPYEKEFKLEAHFLLREQNIRLTGRIDRLDCHADGDWAIIDYKKGGLPAKKDLNSGEEPQLSLYEYMYGYLHGFPVGEKLLCQPFRKDEVRIVVGEASAKRVAARLRTVLRQVDDGVPLPANGTDKECERCSAAGVCRRDHWRSAEKNTATADC